jgi:hypothetical protein
MMHTTTSVRGTAFLVRNGIPLTNIIRVPSGRVIAATYHNTLLINVYAPSGTTQRFDRENFFNVELPNLLRPNRSQTIIGGDFSCVLHPTDTTGHFNTSRALKEIISGLTLHDTWEQNPSQPMYTHHSSHGATRLDRFYISADLIQHKSGATIIPVAFSDHHAMTFRLKVNEADVLPRGRQYRWKMNPLLMHDDTLITEIRSAMAQWRQRQRFYSNTAQWWERCVKTQLPHLIRRATKKQNDDHRRMENHLYECLNDITCSNTPEDKKRALLQKYKAKLIRLHATRQNKTLLDMKDNDALEGEEPSLFHLLKTLRRRTIRNITQVKDIHNHKYTEPQAITDIFLTHLRKKYAPIQVDNNTISILRNNITPVNSTDYIESLESPITKDEVLMALKAGAKRKSPGIDGFCLEFYTKNWETIQNDLIQLLNSMFLQKNIPNRQKHGYRSAYPKTTVTKLPTVTDLYPF